jgi:acyl transferase domain-containing protein
MNSAPLPSSDSAASSRKRPTWKTFQRNILAGVYAAKEAPPGRWTLRAADAFAPQPALDRLYSTRACFVDETEFDLRGLRLDEELLAGLDPLYPMVLHAGRQAFAQAVTDNLDLSRVGVVLAAIALPTEGSSAITDELFGAAFERSLFGTSGNGGGKPSCPQNARVTALPASLLARALNLGGGSCTLDAACASSLYAIKIACDQLASGRIDAALAGGVSRPDSFYTQMGFSQLRALSASGVCRPFDTRADGLVVGEGAGLFVLKRLDDAVQAGDRILGVIRGIGLSNDAAGSLLAADSEGQLRAMRAAYRQAGWRPSDVDLIECHGTGTPQGDATELASLASLWTDEPATGGQCVIGSVKSNIGHLLTAAGAAGLAKVLLAMRDGQLPPTANFGSAARGLAGPFRVATRAEAWKRREDSSRRAAVSAFGFGGINAHLLVEEWTEIARSYAPVKPRLEPIAIVGMDARFGTVRSLDEFAAITLGGGSAFVDRPESRWRGCDDVVPADLERAARRGAYIDAVEVEVGRFRLPPSEIPEVLPQQLLMLESVAAALDDATGNRRDALRTGVMVGMGLDLNTTNFHRRWALAEQARKWAQESGRPVSDTDVSLWIEELREQSGPALTAGRVVGALGNIIASRIAREYGFGGSSFAISSDETSGLSALDVAVSALRRGELDAAVVGAVDLAGDVRAMAARDALRPFSRRGSARPFDAAADGPMVGEGAAAVVLKRLSDAEADGDRVYAVIRGVGFATGGGTDGAACETALERRWSVRWPARTHRRRASAWLKRTAVAIRRKTPRKLRHCVLSSSMASERWGRWLAVSGRWVRRVDWRRWCGQHCVCITGYCRRYRDMSNLPRMVSRQPAFTCRASLSIGGGTVPRVRVGHVSGR